MSPTVIGEGLERLLLKQVDVWIVEPNGIAILLKDADPDIGDVTLQHFNVVDLAKQFIEIDAHDDLHDGCALVANLREAADIIERHIKAVFHQP